MTISSITARILLRHQQNPSSRLSLKICATSAVQLEVFRNGFFQFLLTHLTSTVRLGEALVTWRSLPIGTLTLTRKFWSNNKCAVNDDGCNNQEECSGSKLEPYGENLHVGILGIESYDGVCMTCSYKVLDDSNTADYGVTPTETAAPTLAPVPPTSASASTACSLKCPNCFALDATSCTCIPAANDSCDPCAPVTFDDGTSMTGDDFCAVYMGQNYKCCPPSSNCKKGIITSRTGSDPESRDVSAVCSTNCGGCDAESASACTLFDELTLGCDGKTRTDDLFEICAGEENQIFTDLC